MITSIFLEGVLLNLLLFGSEAPPACGSIPVEDLEAGWLLDMPIPARQCWSELTFSQKHEQFEHLLPISTEVLILTTLTDALEEFVSRIVSGLAATGLLLEERLNLIGPDFSLDSAVFLARGKSVVSFVSSCTLS